MITHQQRQLWYTATAGLLCLFIGIGLCRFAYTPLIPALINAEWLTKASAGYLGTINFIGYLIGAYLGQRVTKYYPATSLIKINLIVSCLGLALCAIHLNFIWLAIWRFLVGATGAFLMVLTPAAILKNIPDTYRGRMAGVIFTGVGIGIVISGSLVPALTQINIITAWLGITLLSICATVFAWPAFKNTKTTSINSNKNSTIPAASQRNLILLITAYTAYGIGFVPHTLFLVDYVHRSLGINMVTSGLFWSAFGIGALIGPFSVGFISDQIGLHKSLIGAYALSCIAILLMLSHHIIFLYVLSSFLMGLLFLGIVTLTSAKIMELIGPALHSEYWGKTTLYYAISQAAGAYVMSYFLHNNLSYTSCFILAEIALLTGLCAICLVRE